MGLASANRKIAKVERQESPSNFIEVALSPFALSTRVPSDSEAWLDSNERDKLSQFTRESDRRRFVASRVLLRRTLSQATGISPSKWRFSLRETGQWELAEGSNLPRLNFSTAHCGEAVAVAVSDSCTVGIDLEPLKAGTLKFPVDGVLAEGELERIAELPAAEQELETLRLWTVKEALAKLVGLGFDLDFSTFEVSLRPPRLLRAGKEIKDGQAIRLTSQECRISRVPYQVSLAFRLDGAESPRIGTQVLEPLIEKE
jgi:phosphopantetheinyl transferase